jgi:hypothetical protein
LGMRHEKLNPFSRLGCSTVVSSGGVLGDWWFMTNDSENLKTCWPSVSSCRSQDEILSLAHKLFLTLLHAFEICYDPPPLSTWPIAYREKEGSIFYRAHPTVKLWLLIRLFSSDRNRLQCLSRT